MVTGIIVIRGCYSRAAGDTPLQVIYVHAYVNIIHAKQSPRVVNMVRVNL